MISMIPRLVMKVVFYLRSTKWVSGFLRLLKGPNYCQTMPNRCKDGPKNQIPTKITSTVVDLPPSHAPGASALRAKRHSPAESKALILANSNRETMRPNPSNGFLRFKMWTCKAQRSRAWRLFQAQTPKLQSFQSRCIVPLETTSGCSLRATDLSRVSKTWVKNFWSSECGERFEFGSLLKAIQNSRDVETLAVSYDVIGIRAGQGVQNLEV